MKKLIAAILFLLYPSLCSAWGVMGIGGGASQQGGGGTYGPVAITDTNNDAWDTSTTSVDLDGLDADGWKVGSSNHAIGGLRWVSTGIPSGATITSATLVIDRGYSNAPTGLDTQIFAEDVDSCAAFNVGEMTTRVMTTAYEDWSIPSDGGADGDYTLNTADFIAVLQELVDRGSFDGTICIFITEVDTTASDNMQFEDVSTLADADEAARLTITWN